MTAGVKLETGHVLQERYLLERVIGQGGMGTVFAAKHLELGETVAVKVLQSESAVATLEAEHLERFLREARLAARIKNDHVVRVIDVSRGKDGSPPFIVMELLEGQDLGELVHSQGRVPIPDAIDYVLQACDALAEAHALGITHRDLKSSNLHLGFGGGGLPIVKVLDFGISKTSDEDGDVNLTSTSSVFGSPAYMSPEQIRSAKHVDQRTDVWAMAVVLYELITADLPFTGNNASAMLASISADAPVPLRLLVPEAPPALEQAIGQALAKNRDQRTPNIVAFAESIAPFSRNGSTLMSAVHRAAVKASSRSNSGPQPAPAVSGGGTQRVSDTMRASDPVMAEATGNRQAYARPPEPIPTPRDAVGRTDREMIMASARPSSSPLLAMLFIFIGVVVAFAVGGVILFVRKPHVEPPVTASTAAAVSAPVVIAPPMPVISAAVEAQSASSSVARPTPAPSPFAKPRPSHHPVSPPAAVPSSKPNALPVPETNSRE